MKNQILRYLTKKLTNKTKHAKRVKYTLKYNQDLREYWSEITIKKWERLETDKAFREGFLLAMSNISQKTNAIRENWDKDNKILHYQKNQNSFHY